MNGICNAKSIATLLAMVANNGELNGVRILNPETIQKMNKITITTSEDHSFGLNSTMSDGGMGVNFMMKWCGVEGDWIGWGGWGGSLAQYNTKFNVSVGYTTVGMGFYLQGDLDPRAIRVIEELAKLLK